MEFNLTHLDYLKLEIIQVLSKSRGKMSVLVLDAKSEVPMEIKIYENREEEK